MGEGESYEQPCEGVINKVDKHKVWNDVNEVEHKINKTGFKFGHLKYLHVSKEVPTRHRYREMSQTLSGKSAYCDASMKCLYSNTHNMGNKHDDSEIYVQLQG